MSEIGDVCRLAADKYLRVYDDEQGCCDAVYEAVLYQHMRRWSLQEKVLQHMKDMGMDTGSYQFFEFEPGVERQSVRHAWLYFCAMIADEGALE